VKATLSERIREIERGDPLLITRNGRPVAALVRPEAVEQLERLRAAGPEGGLASVAGGSEELGRIVERSPRSGASDW
jgi:prevent-host-death family protein